MTVGKKEKVRSMFDTISPKYDLLNHVLSFGVDRSWRRKLVRMVVRSGAVDILDEATGTGDLAIMMAREMPLAEVTGTDISEGMLSVGLNKVGEAGLGDRIALKQEDAENLSFTDGSFDAVTVAFGVRNFEDIPAGLSEMYRVLRNGGKVYVLEFGQPRCKIFGALYRFYFHRILPMLGGIVSKDKNAYRYLPESVDGFPYGGPFVKMMEAAGFYRCGFRNLTAGIAQLYYGEKK